MATPNLDTIADLIVERLKAGTYSKPFEVVEVVRPNQRHDNYVAKPWLCTVTMVALLPGSPYEEEGENPFYRMTAVFHAEVAVVQPEQDEHPIDQIGMQLIFEMAAAIATPAASWHTWEENALNSRWKPATSHAESGVLVTAGLTIEVDVSLRSDNPFESRG